MKRMYAIIGLLFVAFIVIFVAIDARPDHLGIRTKRAMETRATAPQADATENPLFEKMNNDGVIFVKTAPTMNIVPSHPLYLKLCPLMTTVVRWPLDKPTFYSDFYGVIEQFDIFSAVVANGAIYSNPRVRDAACLVDIDSSGVIDGNSYRWHKTCQVAELSVTDEQSVAFRRFNPSSCE